jgi:hypothetical protein
MNRKLLASLAVLLALTLGTAAIAGTEGRQVTLEGDVVCAFCTLKVKGFKGCQNVLLVKKDGMDSEPEQYYFTKNEISDEFGMVCTESKRVRLTGTVTEKDGKKWITPTKIETMTGS